MQIRLRLSLAILSLLLVPSFMALNAQHTANSNATYQQLRGLLPGDDVIAVDGLKLSRDAATFTFTHGDFAFYGDVNGKVTGAVFKGQGHLHITPPIQQERHNLSILYHTEEFDEDFNQVVLRFTDGTAAELRKASAGKGQPDSDYAKAAKDLQGFAKHHLNQNFDLRLLQDVLSPVAGGFFLAAIRGNRDSHLFFLFDPQGVSEFAPEEVVLAKWDAREETVTVPLAFHRTAEYASGTANGNEHNAAYKITSENLDVSIEKSGFLSSLATVEVSAQQEGVAVIPLDLYPTLRVSRVETAKGEALDFVQEDKDEDPDFGVVLAQPLKKGEPTTLKITYGGKDVVINEGGGNYYPKARNNWYPNSTQGLGDYATYRMLFHVPKALQMVATGTKVSESTDGGITTSEWKTEVPLTVVGFSLGKFNMKEATVGDKSGNNLTIDAYANTSPPDSFSSARIKDFPLLFHITDELDAIGTVNTSGMLPVELSQGEAAVKIYTNYFGQLPFSHIALTQQSACDYGQSWPMLVYLPICGFLDQTQQNILGLRPDEMYWKMVTPHEVAHQWWFVTVGFRSYRDQWMSEGFADTSASIFLQATRSKPDQFLEFWKQERKMITERNEFGFRSIDVGPVTMGIRLSSPKAGWNIYRYLVYPKGAYILHMVRMMMWTQKDGDVRFKTMMHDFVESHRLQAATTEDFKAVVEKHMTPQMDLEGNHRMDWFFNQYVYGTDLPVYRFESQTTQNGDATSLHFKLIQSGVPDKFRMPVPIYLELADGKVLRLGAINITGNKTIDQTVQLPKLPSPVKKVVINYFYDVLSIDN